METKTQQDATTTQDDATQEMDELNARLKQLKEQQKEAQKLATELRKRKAQQRKDNKAEKASSHILRAYLALYFANKSEDDARDELHERSRRDAHQLRSDPAARRAFGRPPRGRSSRLPAAPTGNARGGRHGAASRRHRARQTRAEPPGRTPPPGCRR